MPKLLVLDDEPAVVDLFEAVFSQQDIDVVGVPSAAQALIAARREQPDVAILDVSIRGGKVFPVAEKLLERGIPFVLASGYGDWSLPEAMRDRPRLTKPFTPAELEEQIRALCAPGSSTK